MPTEKSRQDTLRRIAQRRNFKLSKSRIRDPLSDNYEVYTLKDLKTGVEWGLDYKLDLDKVERILEWPIEYRKHVAASKDAFVKNIAQAVFKLPHRRTAESEKDGLPHWALRDRHVWLERDKANDTLLIKGYMQGGQTIVAGEGLVTVEEYVATIIRLFSGDWETA